MRILLLGITLICYLGLMEPCEGSVVKYQEIRHVTGNVYQLIQKVESKHREDIFIIGIFNIQTGHVSTSVIYAPTLKMF